MEFTNYTKYVDLYEFNKFLLVINNINVVLPRSRSSIDELVCLTRSMETALMTTVLIKIDDLRISLSQGRLGREGGLLKFTYLPDPTVTRVTPRYATIYSDC